MPWMQFAILILEILVTAAQIGRITLGAAIAPR